jgi:hypothetical protein
MDECAAPRLCCFICDHPFPGGTLECPPTGATLSEIWIDGERIIMICAACGEAAEESDVPFADFGLRGFGPDEILPESA